MSATGSTFRDDSWATWRGDDWAVLYNPGGITAHTPASYTAAGARELAAALNAAADLDDTPTLRAVTEPGDHR